jgi:hypothetical protein
VSAALTAFVDEHDQVHLAQIDGSAPALLDGSLRALCLTPEPDGSVHLFGVNGQGRPWRRRRTSAGSWSPWLAVDGEFTAVAAARNGTGVLELFAVQGISAGSPDSARGTLWRTRETPAGSDGVEPWQLFADGGWAFTDASACTDPAGRVVVVAVRADTSTVLVIAQTQPGDWTGSTWQSLGTPATAVAAGCGAEGVVEIVLTDDDGRLQSSRQTSPGASTWSAWRDLDADWARFTISKLAMAAPTGLLHLYGANADGQVFLRSTLLGDPTRWGAWAPLPMTVRPTLPLTDAPQVTWPGDQQTLLGAPVSLQLAATGGVGPITWTADSLPHGLTCTTTGLISGVPVPGGPASQVVTVTATDTNQAADSAAFSWTTAAQVPDLLGTDQTEAITELHAAGFTNGPATLSNQCLGPAGSVVGQNLTAGAILPEGTQIRLTVSTGLNNKGKPCDVQ